MLWNDYLKNLQFNDNQLTINFDNHFYLKYNSKNINNYYRTYEIWKVTLSKLLNNVLNIYLWQIDDKYKIPNDIIEFAFVYYGGICVYKEFDEIKILPAVPVNKFNIYGEPEFVRVQGFNGYTKEIKIIKDKKDFKNLTGIYVKDNKANILSFEIVKTYARMIANKTRALEIATEKLKKPFICQTDLKNKNNIEKFNEKIENNDPLIIITDKLSDAKTESLNLEIDFENIKAIKESILFDYNQFLEIYGINTDPNPDKQERKLVDEINANNQYLLLNKKSRLEFRKELIKKSKKICNVNLKMEEEEKEKDEHTRNREKSQIQEPTFTEDKTQANNTNK